MNPWERDGQFQVRLREAVLKAGLAVGKYFRSRDFNVQQKGQEGPLTTADLTANNILKEELSRLIPDAGWLSEETADTADRLTCRYVWIVDPIDGTKEFVKNIPEFSVSVGLCEDGLPILGCVCLPGENQIISGSKMTGVEYLEYSLDDAGNFKTDSYKKITSSLSNRTILTGAVLQVSSSEFRHGMFQDLSGDFSLDVGGSIARKLALLAVGRGDLTVSLFPKNDWDICGGTALVRAAGGTVVDLAEFSERLYNTDSVKSYGLAAGAPELVRQFVEYFKRKKIKLEKKYLS